MKLFSALLLSVAVLAGAMASTAVYADRGGGRHFRHNKHFVERHHFRQHHFRQHHFRHHPRAHLGIFIGAPLLFAPWYYPPYYPPAVVGPSSPPVYIERGQPAPAAPDAQAYWYYCPDSQSYYPYVDRCAGPWQRVVPQPPPSP